MTKLQAKSVVLFSTLVLGGVLAPLSHFVYMASADMVEHHGARVDHESTGSHDAEFVDSNSDAEPCSYAALFATQMAGDAPPAHSVVAPDLNTEDFADYSDAGGGLSFAVLSIRGPPSSLSAVS